MLEMNLDPSIPDSMLTLGEQRARRAQQEAKAQVAEEKKARRAAGKRESRPEPGPEVVEQLISAAITAVEAHDLVGLDIDTSDVSGRERIHLAYGPHSHFRLSSAHFVGEGISARIHDAALSIAGWNMRARLIDAARDDEYVTRWAAGINLVEQLRVRKQGLETMVRKATLDKEESTKTADAEQAIAKFSESAQALEDLRSQLETVSSALSQAIQERNSNQQVAKSRLSGISAEIGGHRTRVFERAVNEALRLALRGEMHVVVACVLDEALMCGTGAEGKPEAVLRQLQSELSTAGVV